jgi:phosphoenolpyruvate phosphomutase
MEKKTTRLRQLIQSSQLAFLMEAHNGLSAKIVQKTGFQGIWASGLSISAAMGVRDNNEASWTQVLEVCELMADVTNIPILLDGDTGYGNFNNVRRLVKKVEQRGIAGICIEDKVFPKNNSLVHGFEHSLVDPSEFCGKIKAAKDTQLDNDFIFVARTEALVAGQSVAEALDRAHEYQHAGADAVLIQSKAADFSQISEFMRQWRHQVPVIIVPTTYSSVPTRIFRESEVSVVIWANHTLRAAMKNMLAVCQAIYHQQSLVSIEAQISPLAELFALQDVDELKAAEARYLPKGSGC